MSVMGALEGDCVECAAPFGAFVESASLFVFRVAADNGSPVLSRLYRYEAGMSATIVQDHVTVQLWRRYAIDLEFFVNDDGGERIVVAASEIDTAFLHFDSRTDDNVTLVNEFESVFEVRSADRGTDHHVEVLSSHP